MSGVAVIRQLLLASSDVLALVDGENIAADVFEEGTQLPVIGLLSVSGVPFNTMPPEAAKHIRERVQVKPMVATWAELEPAVLAITTACSDKYPTVAGLAAVSVIADLEGPEGFDIVTGARTKTLDFIVHYNRTV